MHVDNNDPGKRGVLITEDGGKRSWDPMNTKSWPLGRGDALQLKKSL